MGVGDVLGELVGLVPEKSNSLICESVFQNSSVEALAGGSVRSVVGYPASTTVVSAVTLVVHVLWCLFKSNREYTKLSLFCLTYLMRYSFIDLTSMLSMA